MQHRLNVAFIFVLSNIKKKKERVQSLKNMCLYFVEITVNFISFIQRRSNVDCKFYF